MTNTTTEPLTVDDLAAMEDDDRWAGAGYIGSRRGAIDASDPWSDSYDPEVTITPATLDACDEAIIKVANERGWDYERLFQWANHRDGRWFADVAYSGDPADLDKAINVWHLI